jgi:hypothetical protein
MELEEALKPRVVVQKMADVVAAPGDGDLK